ncbi:hypothetical protein SB5_12410 [Pseudomonas oryzihabitans]|nr:hypothetical protein SB5_12410 [Pseudomonas psychrotolerans]
MIIIAGRNLYPADIEALAREAHPLLAEARLVAVALTPEQFSMCMARVLPKALNNEQLVLIAELPLLPVAVALEELAQAVIHTCDHPLAAIIWVARADISVTTSGKIQRAEALRKLLEQQYRVRSVWLSPTVGDSLEGALVRMTQTLGARNTKSMITAALAEVFRIAASLPTPPAADLPLLAIGLSSLAATHLFARLSEATHVRISLAPLYEGWSLAELGTWLRQQPQLRSLDRATSDMLLAGQQAIVQRRLERGDGAYSLAFTISGPGSAIDQITALAMRLPSQIATLGLRVNTTVRGPNLTWSDAAVPIRVAHISGSAKAVLATRCAGVFDLEHGPLQLIRIHDYDEPKEMLLVRVHHIAADFWGMLWIARYLLQPTDKQSPARQQVASIIESADLAYWRDELAALNPVQLLRERSIVPAPPPHCVPFSVALTTLESLSRATGQTPFVMLLTCLFALVQRWTGHWDSAVGVPVSDTSEARPGYGIRVVPIRAKLSPLQAFAEAARHISHKIAGALIHDNASIEQIVAQWRQARTDTKSLFEIAVVHLPSVPEVPPSWRRLILRDGRSQVQLDGLTLSCDGCGPHALEQPIEIVSCETSVGVEGVVRVDAGFFSAATAMQIAQGLERMLVVAAQNPASALETLVDQSTDHGWQTAPRINTETRSVPAMISEWAKSHADLPAIQTPEETLSYQQVEDASNCMARQILLRFKPTLIAVRSSKPSEWLVGLLAGMKAGAAVLPLDNSLPIQRLQTLLRLSGSDLLLDSNLAGEQALAIDEIPRLSFSEPNAYAQLRHIKLPEIPIDSHAYLVFTSGSTGQPKGVSQSHRTFCHFLQWQAQALDMAPGARVAQIAALGFDVALCEIFGALCHGATLVMPQRTVDLAPNRFMQWLDAAAITTMQVTPSLLDEILRGSSGWPRALKTLATVGEPLRLTLARELIKRGGRSFKLINIYGPTETVAACWHPVTTADLQRMRIPVGRPIPGRTVEVRDAEGLPVPGGTKGEIYLRTADMSNGYTSAAGGTEFLLLPSDAADGCGLYRTGDIGRWTADSVLEVLGRLDNQVKFKGVRIELEEVEGALTSHTAVHAAIASVRQVEVTPQLIAFIEADKGTVTADVRRFVLNHLPLVAVPSLIIVVEHLPRTHSGKLDRCAVATWELPKFAPTSADAGLASDVLQLRETIAMLWQEVLSTEKGPGPDTDFFGLGGHSIHAMQMLNLLKTRTGVAISLAQFLAEPTVSALASLVDSQVTLTRSTEVD